MTAQRALIAGLAFALAWVGACRHRDVSQLAAPPASSGAPSDDIFNLQLTKAKLRVDGASDALIEKIGSSADR
ncbi:MAG TPA: hypothetical protein VJP86_07645 [Vicinamibacterales bacterium]|jgi:hypothetical protein|nr:hypothetical protein [Vicinamibacterales bacterium]